MKKLYLFIGLVVLLVGGYFIFFQKPKETDSGLIPVRIGYNSESITNASIIVAYEKGYFQKHGLNPQMTALKGGNEVVLALVAGQVDLGIGSFTNCMQAMAKGAPIRYIAASASSPNFIFTRPDENLNKFTDLYGKTISVGVTGIGNLTFRAAMAQENVSTDKMKFTDIERAYLVAALINKKAVDAVIVAKQDTEMLIKAGAVVLPEWELKGYANQAVPRNSILANSEFLNRQKQAVKYFVEALIDAHRLINDVPTEAAELLAKHIKEGSGGAIVHLPEEIVEQWENKEIVNMIWQDPGVTMKLAKIAEEMKLIDKELALQDVYDLRFESELAAAQKEIYGETN